MSLEGIQPHRDPIPPPPPFPYQEELDRGVETLGDAEALIEEMIGKGEQPIVTFPRHMLDKVREHGLSLRKSWIPGFDKIVGTLGIPAYRDNPDRVAVRIRVDAATDIQPRMTGKDSAFHGVIVFRAPNIELNRLEFLGQDAEQPSATPVQ